MADAAFALFLGELLFVAIKNDCVSLTELLSALIKHRHDYADISEFGV